LRLRDHIGLLLSRDAAHVPEARLRRSLFEGSADSFERVQGRASFAPSRNRCGNSRRTAARFFERASRALWPANCFVTGMSTTATARTKKRTPAVRIAIKDAMTTHPVTIGRDQTLEVAHQMMREHHVRHLPVLEHGQLVGMLSQRDLYFLETIAGVDLSKDRVDDGMSTDTFAVGPDESLQHVAEVMAERKLGSAVVIERDRVIGIFTGTDALRVLSGKPRAERQWAI
jgi:acetoin utilization protein AcuB